MGIGGGRARADGRGGGAERWLTVALLAYAVVVVAQFVLQRGGLGIGQSPALRTLVPPLVLLGPMLAAAVVVTLGLSPRAATRLLGLRIGLPDPFVGVGVGALVRAATTLITLALLGTTGIAPQLILGDVDLWFFVSFLVIPVFVAPVVEEVFFRGVVQRAAVAWLRRRLPATAAATVGIVLAALLFTGAHAVTASTVAGALNSALLVFTLGIAAGALAAVTRRLGAAILAHVAFNGVAVWMSWPF